MRLLTTLIAALCTLTATSQLNLTQLGHRAYSQNLSDIWGYAAAGREYALVGVRNGTSIVDVTNPAAPVQLEFIPGPNSTWRDIKVWGEYAYVTNETDSGLLIINMTALPLSITYKHWFWKSGVNKAHNIYIDEKGYGYIVGGNATGVGGALVVDLFTDPWNPIIKTAYNVNYIHDAYVRGDTMWSAEIYKGWFAAVDMSDKTPASIPGSKVMATQTTPGNFTHNCWLSGDGKTLFTTDEVTDAFIGAYDVSDLQNIKELDRIQSNPGSGVIVHNTFWINNFLVTAYYRDGVHITDVTYPDNMVTMGFYDTSPSLSGTGFNGCWGVYPYLPSGNIIASDIENGLYVLGPIYQQACYLEGIVTDSITGLTISGADVTIDSATYANTTSKISGDYKTGFQTAGVYAVTFNKVGYYPKTYPAVSMQNGVITVQNAVLKPRIPFAMTGTVRDSVSGAGIAGSKVLLVTVDTAYSVICDLNGVYTVPAMYEGSYDVYAGHWGYITRHQNSYLTGNAVDFDLPQGYYDDFILNFNWTVTGNANAGIWERGEPIGTTNGPDQSNPDFDVTGDFGDKAYVTGNGGGGVGDDDVDGGSIRLTSPLFDLTGYVFPAISFHRWFYNGGGASAPNDSLQVRLSNGSTTAVIDLAVNGDPGESQWIRKRIDVNTYMTPTSTMSFSIETADRNPGHLVEGGLDLFYVFDSLHAPVAEFTADELSGCEPLMVHFVDESQQAQSWDWQMPGSVEGSSTDQNPTATYMTAGTYSVTLKVTNITGEDSISKPTFITVFDNPVLATGSTDDNGSGNGTATAAPTGGIPPFSYLWNDPSQQTTATATELTAGWYTVIVTDANGCEAVDSVEVVLNSGIELLNLGFTVAPNPSTGSFLITFKSDASNISARLFASNGQMLRQWKHIAGNELLISDLPASGLYQLILRSNDGASVSVNLIRVD